MNESTVMMEWHCEDGDLTAMYASVKPDGEILLWCGKRQTLPSGAGAASNSRERNTGNSDAPRS